MSATTTSDSTFARYQDLLIGLGKEPSDLRIAEAHTTDPSAPEQYEIYAMRVDGVAADILFDRFFPAAYGADVPPSSEMPTMTFGDRTDISREPDEPSTWMFVYARGEALFMGSGSGGVTMEEAFAELPFLTGEE